MVMIKMWVEFGSNPPVFYFKTQDNGAVTLGLYSSHGRGTRLGDQIKSWKLFN